MRMKPFAVCISVLLCVAMLGGITACSGGDSPVFRYESDDGIAALVQGEAPAYPPAEFIVFTDVHLYDPSLGMEGQAFDDYLSNDRKLIRESVEILETVVDKVSQEEAGIVFVAGDMTKDGERASHELVAGYFSQLEDGGKRVYVVPGNHDINNGHSYGYSGDSAERVPPVSPAEFAEIYHEFGYDEALYRDPGSLSYVTVLEDGLWLLALDSCLYRENVDNEEPETDGSFTPATLEWIEEMLIHAAQDGTAVVAIMHHGITEHYNGQEKNYGEYIVDDFPAVSKLFAMYNVRLVFTGHYHAQDVTLAQWDDEKKFLFDVETGSLVTYPVLTGW
jgi:3',5'-cyclic AMP phosphodiesterase CpdA